MFYISSPAFSYQRVYILQHQENYGSQHAFKIKCSQHKRGNTKKTIFIFEKQSSSLSEEKRKNVGVWALPRVSSLVVKNSQTKPKLVTTACLEHLVFWKLTT